MVMDSEEDWMRFLEMHCGENGVITDSRAYSGIADRFPIPLMHKLISTAGNDNVGEKYRDRAAVLIADMIEEERLDSAYSDIDRVLTRLPYFRRSAIRLMISYDRGSPLQLVGTELTKKLIELSLQHNDDGWDAFLELRHLNFRTHSHVLEMILDVFGEVGLDDDDEVMRQKFADFLEPALRENAHQLYTRLLELFALNQMHDDRSFKILPFLHRIFTHAPHWATLMEAAIMSPYFDFDPHNYPERMLSAAKSVKLCIERGAAFRFSLAMIRKINGIILRLYSYISADICVCVRERDGEAHTHACMLTNVQQIELMKVIHNTHE
ncbi:hypothetical protein C2S53_009241 [Perilla frutescens var. hirtella]|uniref:Uncharacterized protein n=1 Tax=Perilla frutescens var. hirtella TaxID=608512 RepID=A0AAD4NY49_PERFH|nr:hypothetical protein C2S53_009241 [Perilla frutescens var. hirtella]